MRSQCSLGFKVIGPAKLENYELGFDCRGYANIRAKPGEYVWGVLFDILKTCLIELDKCEGYNRDPRVYDRVKIPVVHGNKKVQAWVYVEEPQEFGRKPNLKYLKRIIEGAEENNLPADWLHKLKTFHI